MSFSPTRGSGLLEGFLSKQRSNLADSLIPFEKRAGRLLDIGCGSYPYFLFNTVFREKHGIDQVPSPGNLHAFSEKNITLKNHNVAGSQKFPYEDACFDVVTMLAVFEHIEQDRIPFVLSEIKRILKKSGICIVTTPAAWTENLLRFMAALGLVSADEINEHKDAYDHDKLRRLLVDAGFSPKNIRLGYFEFFMNIFCVVQKSEP